MFTIGGLALDSNLFLSPLAGYTNLPFRLTVRELGAVGLATTDLVNARSLLERNRKALKLIETNATDRPLAVQLFGAVPEEMRDAAQYLQDAGVQAIDINMGCPVRKVCKVGGGSAMMVELKKTTDLVKGMVNAVRIPVTAKMRLGWDDSNWSAPELARALEDAGVAAVFVHGRTREQGFSGPVKLEGIRAVVEAVKAIPVIGNGDLTTPLAAREMLTTTGCHGISIGRGAFYNPWIFRQTLHYLKTGELLPEPSFADRLAVVRRHFELMVEVFGEEMGCRMFRKVGPWYARRFGPANEFNRRIVQLRTAAEFAEILEQYQTWRSRFLTVEGQLKPGYEPAQLPTTFRQASSEPIRVPVGPVELW